jgi:hypothetical protein
MKELVQFIASEKTGLDTKTDRLIDRKSQCDPDSQVSRRSAFVREFSVQLWSVNPRTTEAEEVTICKSQPRQSQWKRRHS